MASARAALASIGLLLLGLSVATANLALLAFAALPLGLLAASLLPRARALDASLAFEPSRRVVGQEVAVTVTATVSGRGPLALHVPLPESFRLTQGRNIHRVWVHAAQPQRLTWTFKVAGDRRGGYEVGPVRCHTTHPMLAGPDEVRTVGATGTLRIDSRGALGGRLGRARVRGRINTPELDLIPTGVTTTDFREIRDYARGDPHRAINWKASARRGERGDASSLLVNEYEREGKRAAWIFLDGRGDADLGTTLDNGFERRAEAATAIANHHLARGHPVGLTVFHHPEAGLGYADASSRQRLRLAEVTTRLAPYVLPNPAAAAAGTVPASPGGAGTLPPEMAARSLHQAVDAVRGQLRRQRTTAYVVTSLHRAPPGLADGIRHLRNAVASRRAQVPVTLIDVDPTGLLPDPDDSLLAPTLRALDQGAQQAFRRLGVRRVRWDPRRRSLQAVLGGLG